MKLHIIAEACTNHDGNPSKAKELIDAAYKSGADSVKFQIIYPEGLYIAKVAGDTGWVDNPVCEQRRKSMLSDEIYNELAEFSHTLRLPFSASVFDTRGLDLLDKLNAPYIKIASCDLNNTPFLSQAAERGRRLIISTGMAELAEIEQAMETVNKFGASDVVLLHCVSIYPAPIEKTNLAMIPLLSQKFGVPVGFSDHSKGVAAASAALALGATWFEKHFTLRTSDTGFDHVHSTAPDEFKNYVQKLHALSEACNLQHAKVGEEEAALKLRARRGLYAARDIGIGETITLQDILIVRPETTLKPTDLARLLGKRLMAPLSRYDTISDDILD